MRFDRVISLNTLNMTAPLSICTKDKQRAVIRFLWFGMKAAQINPNSCHRVETLFRFVNQFFSSSKCVWPHQLNTKRRTWAASGIDARGALQNILPGRIGGLLACWIECIADGGECIEKQCIC